MFAAYSLSTQEIVLLFSIGVLMVAFPAVAAILGIWLARRRDQQPVPDNTRGTIDEPEDASALPVA
jgi:hypothetical protein